MKALTQAQRDTLEEMIDASDLASVLHGLAEVCCEKATHLVEAWHDFGASDVWTKWGQKVEALGDKVTV